MVPTLTTTLGVKGHRPEVGTYDNKDVVHVFGSADLVRGRLISRVVESRLSERRKDGLSKTKRMQAEFAAHLRQVGRAYPAEEYGWVVLVIDNALWHSGRVVEEAMEEQRHLMLYRLPSYSPELSEIEDLWKPMRQQVTHNRLYEQTPQLTAALTRKLLHYKRRPKAVLRTLGLLPTSAAA
jgi:hypothetical protein